MSLEVTIRLYEELNDYISPDLKKKESFTLNLKDSSKIRDVLQILKIPENKVDLILINSKPKSSKSHVKNGDFISLYPVFESFNISNIKAQGTPLRKTQFVLDVHLGRLTRYLRFLGFDSYYRNDIDDDEIIKISLNENRIILTRDKGIIKDKRVTHAYHIKNQKPKEQLNEVIKRFDLKNNIKPFTICSICNGKIEEVPKNEILEFLKPLTRKHYNVFFRCTQCKQIYWEGSHFEKISKWIKKLVEKE